MPKATAGMIGTLSCGMRHGTHGKKGGIGQPMTRVRQRASLPVDAVKHRVAAGTLKRETSEAHRALKVALSALPCVHVQRGRRERGGRQDAPRVNRQRRPSPRNPGGGRPAALQRELLARCLWNRAFSTPAATRNAQLCLQALSVWTAHTQAEHAIARRGRGYFSALLPRPSP